MKILLKKLINKFRSKIVLNRPSNRSNCLHFCYEFIAKSDLNGPYAEFGTYEGKSFINAYEAISYWTEQAEINGWRFNDKQMYAFDSFEGLPSETENEKLTSYSIFKPKQYACAKLSFQERLKRSKVQMGNVHITEGFFDQSLAKFSMTKEADPFSVINIDCDLYSSAVPVFDFITTRVQDGCILILDDYFCYRGHPSRGVRRALDEWIEKNDSYYITPYFKYSWAGQVFILSIKE